MFRFIKWLLKTLLLFTGILPLFRCSSGYSEKNGKITYNGNEITDKSFIVLSDVFAKDSAAAYYKEKPIPGADVATFQAVDDHYAKDKNKVYYCDTYREGQNYYLTKRNTIDVVKNALPESFVSLESSYAKDSKHAYFEGIPFAVKDVATLSCINWHFVKDDVQAYLDRRPVPGSDGKSFEITDNNFAKDKDHIYYYAYTAGDEYQICILPCDRASFEILDYRYSKDKTNVFFLGFTIKGADGATFQLLDEGYSKDKDAVYFESKKIPGADAATFVVYAENGEYGHDFNFAKDKNTVFMDDQKLAAADVPTFKVLGENYGSDKDHVFYKTKVVKDADPGSFKVYPHDFGNADSEDANNKFHEGVTVVDE